MLTIKTTLQAISTWITRNLYELWASLAIFIGLPLIAWLYFDYRAAILMFVTASIVIPIIALVRGE